MEQGLDNKDYMSFCDKFNLSYQDEDSLKKYNAYLNRQKGAKQIEDKIRKGDTGDIAPLHD